MPDRQAPHTIQPRATVAALRENGQLPQKVFLRMRSRIFLFEVLLTVSHLGLALQHNFMCVVAMLTSIARMAASLAT